MRSCEGDCWWRSRGLCQVSKTTNSVSDNYVLLFPRPTRLDSKIAGGISTNNVLPKSVFAVVGELQSGDRTRRIECQVQFELVKKKTTRTSSEG
jgi:hypothetical protein